MSEGERKIEVKAMNWIVRCVILAMSFYGLTVMAIEEPEFDTLSRNDSYEIRRYESYVVAEVDVAGDFKTAGNRAFQVLAGYIFGDNAPNEKMAMTAPVESRRHSGGEKMKMTAPVQSSPSAQLSDGFTYSFVMESKYTMDTLPEPTDPEIRLREIPGRVVAVRRYSGGWSQEKYQKEEAVLLEALAVDDIVPVGEPVFARYNPPFMPWFMRRNEIIVELPDRQYGMK